MLPPSVPTDDPYGLAMLAAAAVAGLALLWLIGARISGRGLRSPAWLLGLACAAFLGAAGAGTAERIVAAGAGAEPAPTPPPPPPPPEPEPVAEPAAPAGSTGAEAPSPGTGQAAPADAEPVTAEALVEDMLAAAAEGDYLRVGQRYRVLSAMQPPPEGLDAAWERVAKERSKAVRQWVADAVAVARGRCDRPDPIAAAMAKLRTVAPAEPTFAAAKRAVRKLEACRTTLERHTKLATKRERMDARKRFAEALAKRLRAEHPKVRVTTGGKGVNARIRIAPIPADAAAKLVEDGLLEEAEGLGFGHVTFSDGRTSKTHDLEPRADTEVAAQKMQDWGLGTPLALEP